MDQQEDIRRALLRKLAKHGWWGGRHTSFDNLPKGFPRHLAKEVKDLAKDMIKTGILLAKPTNYGLEISLNPNKKREIEEIVGNG